MVMTEHITERPDLDSIIAEELELPELTPVRLSKRDASVMAEEMGRDEVRWLVDTYYQLQEFRKASGQQVSAANKAAEPSSALKWTFGQMAGTEASLRRIMDEWTDLSAPGRWAKSQMGIGGVLAAGLLATFDPERPTVGSWWRFAGLDPTVEWNKGEKRPFSAKAKLLCWKVGDSFVKVSNRPTAYYGQAYRARKAYELERDTTGGNKYTADLTLVRRNFRDAATKKTYESGHLPAGRLDLRARRWATKLFLSHLHYVMWQDRTGSPPPKPYVIEHMGHAEFLAPPNWPMDE